MRYVKTFVQEGRRYSEEISEDQRAFYTSKNYISDHIILELIEDEKPVINEELEYIESRLEVSDTEAREVYEVKLKPTGDL